MILQERTGRREVVSGKSIGGARGAALQVFGNVEECGQPTFSQVSKC